MSWANGFSPALLRTCRQIFNEGSSILYNENRFRIWTENILNDESGSFLGFQNFFKRDRDYDHDLGDLPVQKFKKFHIVADPELEVHGPYESSLHVMDVCKFLSEVSDLATLTKCHPFCPP